MMYQLRLGFRSLFYRKEQYTSLFLVCVVGIAVSLACIAVSTGMIEALNDKAKVYYGGDLAFMEAKLGDIGMQPYEDYVDVLQGILGPDAVVSGRIDYDARRSLYIFEGTQALQKTIKGVDFEKERPLFENFKFVAGGIDDIAGTNGVLISEPIANILHISVGDSMTFQLRKTNNYIDTVDIVVKGIFQDSSVFGMYTSYMDFGYLKEIYGRDADFASRICIFFPNRKVSQKDIRRYQAELEKVYNMFPLVTDKDAYLKQQDFFTKPVAILVPLEANLADVKIMELAMNAVVSFVIVMLVVIIVAGIGSTYRILIMKRINEIGIYMAIGMKKGGILATLLWESLTLLVCGCIGGVVLSAVICALLSLIDFSFIPSFTLFLVKGNLSPTVDVIKSGAVMAAVMAVTLAAVAYATWKSITIMPVNALAVTE